MQLTDILKHVTLGAPRQWKNLQVFPLMQPNGHDPSYTLIDDLLDRGQAEITEVSDGGAVPTIKVLNHADSDALILDGTELRGAKQNRMVNVTVIVGKHSDTPIPVSCVERGRWAYRARGFASSKRTVASKLRNRKAHMVAENLARTQRAATNQGEVWSMSTATSTGQTCTPPPRPLTTPTPSARRRPRSISPISRISTPTARSSPSTAS